MPEKTLRISVPSPCQQSWEAMPEAGAGRYCGQCSKVIIDFTKLSDKELIGLFTQKQSGQLCGTFSPQQLEKTYAMKAPAQERSYTGMKLALAGLLSFPLLSQAQTATPKPQVHKEQSKQTRVQHRYIKGKVIDRSSKKGITARIRLYTSRSDTIVHSTFSADSTGYYELALPDRGLSKFFKLVYSSENYLERTVVVDLETIPGSLVVSLTAAPIAPEEPKNQAVPLQAPLKGVEVISVTRIMGIPQLNHDDFFIRKPYQRLWRRFVRLFRRY